MIALAGCGSTPTVPVGTSRVRSATSPADNPGDQDAPCAAVFSLADARLRLVVSTTEAGEVIINPVVNGPESSGTELHRDLPHVDAGSATSVTFGGVRSVAQIPVVIYTTPDTSYTCSITRKGDPVQRPFRLPAAEP